MPHSATIHHLRTQQIELDHRHDLLTRRIGALDTDIGRELDLERKLVLQDRRADLVQERDQIMAELSRLEQTLSFAPSEPVSLVFLEGRLEAQHCEGRISATERDMLMAIFRRALSETETPEFSSISDLHTDPIIVDEGVIMTTYNTHILNLAESVFTRTSFALAQDLAKVVEHQSEWTDLIVGDPVTDRTIQALNSMQERMKSADRVASQYVAPTLRKRFQMERDGMISSAKELVCIFDELSYHLSSGKVPWSVHQQMERQLDDLTYYTNRCLLWLSDLAVSARQSETLQ